MHYAKPYPRDYRQSPYYKQSFHLKLSRIFKKYKLKYDPTTGNIINMKTKEAFLFSVMMNQHFSSRPIMSNFGH